MLYIYTVYICFYQRFQGIHAVWAVVSTAISTSHPASASVTLASLDTSARVPVIDIKMNSIKIVYLHMYQYQASSIGFVHFNIQSEGSDCAILVSVFQCGAACSVYTVISKRKNALACVMLATVVLSVQVTAVCFVALNVFFLKIYLRKCILWDRLVSKLKSTQRQTHTEEANLFAPPFCLSPKGC